MKIQSIATGYIYNVLDFDGKHFLIENNNEEQWWKASRFKMYHDKINDINTELHQKLICLYKEKEEYEFILKHLRNNYISCNLEVKNQDSGEINNFTINEETIDALIEYYEDRLEEINKEVKSFKLNKM